MTSSEPVWPAELFKDLDRNGPIPLYFQVAQRLEDGIRDGVLPPGARLENEISLAKRLSVSRPTVRRAIQEVVDKGLLVRRRGVGTQVVKSHVTRPVELTSFYNDLKNAKLDPKTQVLEHRLMAANSSIAEKLGVSVGDEVLFIRRVRSTGDTPVAILKTTFHQHLMTSRWKSWKAAACMTRCPARCEPEDCKPANRRAPRGW